LSSALGAAIAFFWGLDLDLEADLDLDLEGLPRFLFLEGALAVTFACALAGLPLDADLDRETDGALDVLRGLPLPLLETDADLDGANFLTVRTPSKFACSFGASQTSVRVSASCRFS